MHLLDLALLPTHPTSGLRAIGVVGGRPVWPVMGAADDDGSGDDSGGDDSGAGGGGQDIDKGFPAGTPVAEMTTEQQVAYWRHQSRKHESTAKARGDYDAQKAKAAQFDALEQASRTEQERAVEAAKAEGRAEAASVAAGQRLVGLLVARGKTEDEADEIVDDLNLSRYVKDGKPDRDAIAKVVDRLAPKGTARGDGTGKADLGQGSRKPAASSGKDRALAMAQKRFGTTSTATQ